MFQPNRIGEKKILDQILDAKTRTFVICAALLALFLGALDALIVSAAMPTIVAELGGLHLYSWVYSAYFLARAVSLPIFGKLADRLTNKTLLNISIIIFILASILAGLSTRMLFLIIARAFQGIGAGGIFALVYIILADIASPAKRGKILSLAGSIWGIASVLGPTLGGFIVSYLSWCWIFLINVPLGLISLFGITNFLIEVRTKKKDVDLDLMGVFSLSLTILGLLTAFILGGHMYAWSSPLILILFVASAAAGVGFYFAEKNARDPILSLQFFSDRGFSIGNGATFLSSFAIFALFAYAPLFIQGALGKSPMQVGIAMLSLSLGWSIGSLALGQVVHRIGKAAAAVWGALFLVAGCAWTLFFSTTTSMTECFFAFQIAGLGMGFVTLSTLLLVQDGVSMADLGVATASNQFARTLGGTVGVGICGGLVTGKFLTTVNSITETHLGNGSDYFSASSSRFTIENLYQPEMRDLLSSEVYQMLQEAVVAGVSMAFWVILLAAGLCFGLCLWLPGRK